MDRSTKSLTLTDIGQWLEDFLDPDAKPVRFKKLALQAIRDYNLKFKLSDDDITIVDDTITIADHVEVDEDDTLYVRY